MKKICGMAMRRILTGFNKVLIELFFLAVRLAEFFRLIEVYQPLPDVGVGKRAYTPRILDRLEAIKRHLPSGKLSGIDIGCNVGFYTFELAKLGHFMLAFEPQKPFYFIANMAREKTVAKNTAFSDMRLSPRNLETLPTADFVVLLAVFHHWCRLYGPDSGLDMLQTILAKTRKVLFFETGRTDLADSPEFAAQPRLGADGESWLPGFARDNHHRGAARATLCHARERCSVANIPR